LHGGSLEIMLTVPLIPHTIFKYFRSLYTTDIDKESGKELMKVNFYCFIF